MIIGSTKQEYLLTAENIDLMSESIQEFLRSLKMNEKNILWIRLSMEEMLLKWQSHFGEECACHLATGSRLGRPYLTLTLAGEEFDPSAGGEDEMDNWSERLLANLGLSPTFSYQKGTNRIQLMLNRKSRNPVVSILFAIGLALLFGFLGQLLPNSVRSYINDVVLTSVYQAFLGLLTTIAGPMIFLSVVWGIYGIGDLASFGKFGKSMFLQLLMMLVLVTIAVMGGSILFYSLSVSATGGGVSGQGGEGLFQMVMQILPSNIVQPFLDGNSLQIIVIAIALGVAMLVMGNQAREISKVVEQLNQMIQYIMGLISKLLPVFVFVILLQRIWSDSLKDVLHAWKLLLGVILFGTFAVAVVFVYVAIRLKVNMGILAKKLLPAFLIALTTSSSSAAFGTNISCCENQMGISGKITKFGIPLGTVIYMPVSCVMFVCCACYVAATNDIAISPMWLVMATFIIVILSIALPPVPGGALTSYTILFLQLGLPQEALAVVLTMDVLLECFITSMHVTSLQLQLLLLSHRMDLLDTERLRSN